MVSESILGVRHSIRPLLVIIATLTILITGCTVPTPTDPLTIQPEPTIPPTIQLFPTMAIEYPDPVIPTNAAIPPTTSVSPPTTSNPSPVVEKTVYVLWDLSHGPRQSSEIDKRYEPDGLYSQLKTVLGDMDIILTSSREPLEDVDLKQYALVVIAMTSAEKQNFTSIEAEIIGDFVKGGGSILILAENPDYPNRIREVTDYFGIDVGKESISKAITNLKDHPVFDKVNEVFFEFDGGSINIRDNKAQVIASKNDQAAVVVIENLPGRVVVIGDSNLFDNRGLSRNKQFATNLFLWLTHQDNF